MQAVVLSEWLVIYANEIVFGFGFLKRISTPCRLTKTFRITTEITGGAAATNNSSEGCQDK